MSDDSTTEHDREFSGDATRTIEIDLPEDKVNEILCLLDVPLPDARDLGKVLIHIKHELGFQAGLRARKNNS